VLAGDHARRDGSAAKDAIGLRALRNLPLDGLETGFVQASIALTTG
jgi:hypothetical protein